MIINTSIALRIRWRSLSEGKSRQPIAIGFVAAFLVILIPLSGSYTNAANKTSPAKTCQKQTSIKIIDESDGRALLPISVNSSDDPPSRNYVNIISKYTFDKIDEIDNSNSCRVEAELTFVYRPLISEGVAPSNFKWIKSKNTKYLDTPWVKLSITKSPKLVVRAAFIWNERQFLFDQVLMSEPSVSLEKPLLPLSRNIFERYEEDYLNVMFPRSEKDRTAAQVSIEKKLPADLLWGFRRGWRNTRGGLVSDTSVNETIEQVIDKYINITETLLTVRFESPKISQRYQSILNLKDVFNVNLYRIKSLY